MADTDAAANPPELLAQVGRILNAEGNLDALVGTLREGGWQVDFEEAKSVL